MSHFEIRIETDNDAFGETDDTKVQEILDILEDFSMSFSSLKETVPLMDANGLKVGEAIYRED